MAAQNTPRLRLRQTRVPRMARKAGAQQSTAQTTVRSNIRSTRRLRTYRQWRPRTSSRRTGQHNPILRQDNAPPSPARQPQTVTIEAGTSLMVRLGETISTKTKVAGDSFRGTLDQPIIMNGFVIADRGIKGGGSGGFGAEGRPSQRLVRPVAAGDRDQHDRRTNCSRSDQPLGKEG